MSLRKDPNSQKNTKTPPKPNNVSAAARIREALQLGATFPGVNPVKPCRYPKQADGRFAETKDIETPHSSANNVVSGVADAQSEKTASHTIGSLGETGATNSDVAVNLPKVYTLLHPHEGRPATKLNDGSNQFLDRHLKDETGAIVENPSPEGIAKETTTSSMKPKEVQDKDVASEEAITKLQQTLPAPPQQGPMEVTGALGADVTVPSKPASDPGTEKAVDSIDGHEKDTMDGVESHQTHYEDSPSREESTEVQVSLPPHQPIPDTQQPETPAHVYSGPEHGAVNSMAQNNNENWTSPFTQPLQARSTWEKPSAPIYRPPPQQELDPAYTNPHQPMGRQAAIDFFNSISGDKMEIEETAPFSMDLFDRLFGVSSNMRQQEDSSSAVAKETAAQTRAVANPIYHPGENETIPRPFLVNFKCTVAEILEARRLESSSGRPSRARNHIIPQQVLPSAAVRAANLRVEKSVEEPPLDSSRASGKHTRSTPPPISRSFLQGEPVGPGALTPDSDDGFRDILKKRAYELSQIPEYRSASMWHPGLMNPVAISEKPRQPGGSFHERDTLEQDYPLPSVEEVPADDSPRPPGGPSPSNNGLLNPTAILDEIPQPSKIRQKSPAMVDAHPKAASIERDLPTDEDDTTESNSPSDLQNTAVTSPSIICNTTRSEIKGYQYRTSTSHAWVNNSGGGNGKNGTSRIYYNPQGQPARGLCKFFFSEQGCRKRNSCQFSHDSTPPAPDRNERSLTPEEDGSALFPVLSSEFEIGDVFHDDEEAARLVGSMWDKEEKEEHTIEEKGTDNEDSLFIPEYDDQPYTRAATPPEEDTSFPAAISDSESAVYDEDVPRGQRARSANPSPEPMTADQIS
jgi:hypothetical protein